VFRAGTYVGGISVLEIARSFGTGMSPVSAEPPKRGQIHVQLDVPFDTEGAGHPPRCLNLVRMTLAVSNRQGVQEKAFGLRNRRRRVRVQAAAEQHDGRHF
jgi:hypothetical protein